jgi:MSHA biogenesis protein MshJ
MRHYWELARNRVDAMSLRERAMLFCIAALLLVFVINALLLDPLLARKNSLSTKFEQQQREIRVLQASVETILQSRREDEHSPLRTRIQELKARLQESDSFLQSRRDRLVSPGKMSELLEQVLHNNHKLQLVELKTLPLGLLVEEKSDAKAPAAPPVYKHGVQITVRGGYLELLNYLAALEKLPAQMFWGELSLSVEKHPDALLILTVYTLSLDKAWLTV